MARNGIKSGGRQKGSLNKNTVEEKDRAARVLDLIEAEFLEDDIRALSPHQRMMLYSDMMEYKSPKLARTTIVGDPNEPLHAVIQMATPGDAKEIQFPGTEEDVQI